MQKKMLVIPVVFSVILFYFLPAAVFSQEVKEGWFTMDVADSGLAGSADVVAVNEAEKS